MEKFKSNVYGRLIVNGKLLRFGEEVELPSDLVNNKKEIRDLIKTKQLVRA